MSARPHYRYPHTATTHRAGHVWSKTVRSLVLVSLSFLGCGVIKEKKDAPPSDLQVIGKPMPPDKAKEVLSEVGSNFAYGPGLGDTALNVGAAVVFPPYAIYLLGNAALSLSGYEPITVASMLPPEDGEAWSDTYDTIVSGPGKMVAAVAGHEYRSREVADAKMEQLLKSIDEENAKSETVKSEP